MADAGLIERAIAQLEAGRYAEAEALCEQAAATHAALRPDALHIRALCAHACGELARAVEHLTAAVEADPMNLGRRLNLGILCFEAQRYHLAAAHMEVVLARAGEVPEALNCLGNALCRLGQYPVAVERLERALSQMPREPKYWADLAACYLAWGRPRAAVDGYRTVTRLLPDNAEAHYNLGVALLHADRPGDAAEAFKQATRGDRDNPQVWLNLGIAHKRSGRIGEARKAQTRALSLAPDDPELRYNLGLTELLRGDYREGFAHFEARLSLPGHPLGPGPYWDGRPLPQGTLVALAEQGIGDTLQFLRFAPQLAAACAELVIQVRPALLPLLRASYHGPGQLQALGTELAADAVRIPLMSVPHVLGLAGEALGARTPYLTVDAEAVQRARTTLQPLPEARLRVGLAWQGNPKYRADAQRSMRLRWLHGLLQTPDVAFVALQRGPGREQLQELPHDARVLDLGDLDAEDAAFAETAAVLCALDLLVTTDTAIAHLAGALGVPVWVMLPAVPDFRWGLCGQPWYPSMRLFRQPAPGDWSAVVAQVTAALQQRLSQEAA